jgi:MOSC domain-containing protein YiiM
MTSIVTAISASPSHSLAKAPQLIIRLVAGLGVAGDAHMGATVKHRSRVAKDPTVRNLRQVHLMHSELHDELRAKGFDIAAGRMGENITTRGLDVLALPTGTKLHIGREAVIELTGLRNPCSQLDKIQPGLMEATLARGPHGDLIRKAGVMAIVLKSGDVQTGDSIRVEWPAAPHQPLKPV